ncbi:hypothetical protein CK203_111722 [Vitis vinifera]|uniref:Uncharacterized protein n=1 Tax=Vitis vinifera TaxID=29760 RepID=A0A438DDC4_VITVI|nr:hypothetical protein CK203_111722 [Vitis vinifera]
MRNSMDVRKDAWKLSTLVLTMALIHGYCSRRWDEPNAREVGIMNSQPNASNAKAGMYTLNEGTDTKANYATLARRRMEELEVQAISDTPMQAKSCSICQSFEHLVEECPMMPAIREMFGDQANFIGQFKPNNNALYSNTYNSNWRNHPNFSWKPRAPQYTQPNQAPSQASNLEQAILNLNKIDNLQYQISRLTNLNTVHERGKFPSQPHQNPKVIHEVEAHEGKSSQMREVKAVITLRSGKEVDLPTPKPKQEPEQEPETKAEKKKMEENKGKKKGSSTKKEDLEAKVNEKPEKTINQ